MSVNIRESMKERQSERRQRRKGKEGRGKKRRGDRTAAIVGVLEMTWTWPSADKLQQRDTRPLQSRLCSRDERGLDRCLCVIMRQPSPTHEAFISHSLSCCVQPTQKTGEMNSRLSNQAWLHRDNAARFHSLHTLWHLRRRRNHKEHIRTCTFNLYSLITAPCL